MGKSLSEYRSLLICGALTVVILSTFGQVLNNGFTNYDDDQYLTKNFRTRGGLTIENIGWAFTTKHASNWHPITWLSHMLDCQLFGLNPRWHHLTSLLLHTVNAILLLLVLKTMTGALWQSAFVAGAFALHPLHVESVAWAAERKDVLSTLFWFLTMAAYLRYTKTHSVNWYLLTVFFFILGLMAKPMLVTLPFVLLLLDYWPLGRFDSILGVKDNRRQIFYRLVIEKIPFFVLSALSSAITFFVQQTTGAIKNIDILPLNIRLANAVISYTKYLQKMIWPSELAVIYPYEIKSLSIGKVAVSALLLLTISILVIRSARKSRYLVVGWLWYVGTLFPVIGLVQVGIQAMADRYTYVPLTGLFIIIAWGVGDLSVRWQNRKIVLGVLTLITLWVLCKCTILQLRYWQDSIILFEHTLAVTGDNNIVAHNNLGNMLQSQGKLDEAIGHYQQALQVNPNSADAHNNLGIAMGKQGKLDKAIEYFRRALELRPNFVEAHSNLAYALKLRGNLDEAADHYRQALKLNPNSVEAHNNYGCLLLAEKQFDEAIDHFRKALQLEPDLANVHCNLANALSAQGKLDEAIDHYRQALKINPNYIEANKALQKLLKTTK